MKQVDWLWTNHLARGKLTMLCGDSTLGKSQISISLTAVLTKTGVWPDGDSAPSGSVIILSAEDATDDTVVPRLAAAGADAARVHCLKCVRVEGKPQSFNIQTNMNLVAQKVREVGDAALVIIDPVTAYLGSEIDSHRTTEVRAALMPLEQLAKDLNVAVLAIAHPPKTPSTKALNYIAGSGAFTHAPRLTFLVIEDPELPSRTLLLAVKNNLGRKADGLGYSIVSRTVGPNESILSSYIHWDDRPVYMTANEALAAHAEKKKAKASGEAEDFLREKMQPGQNYAASEIKREAADAGIAGRTLDRASKSLGLAFPFWPTTAPLSSTARKSSRKAKSGATSLAAGGKRTVACISTRRSHRSIGGAASGLRLSRRKLTQRFIASRPRWPLRTPTRAAPVRHSLKRVPATSWPAGVGGRG
jgi:putative DNA primase/helicase